MSLDVVVFVVPATADSGSGGVCKGGNCREDNVNSVRGLLQGDIGYD